MRTVLPGSLRTPGSHLSLPLPASSFPPSSLLPSLSPAPSPRPGTCEAGSCLWAINLATSSLAQPGRLCASIPFPRHSKGLE